MNLLTSMKGERNMRKRNNTDDSTIMTIPKSKMIKAPVVTIPNEYTDIEHTTVFKDIVNELIDSKIIMSRRELMNKNIIKLDNLDDMSRFMNLDQNIIGDEKFACYKANESIYTSIPCFQEGVYYIKETEQYYHWIINKLNLTESGYLMDIRVTVYLRELDVCDGIMLWIPIGSIRYKTDGREFHSVSVPDNSETADFSLNILMKAVSLCPDCKKSEKEKEILLETANYYQNKLFPNILEVTNLNWEEFADEILLVFNYLTRFTSYTMFNNKPVVDRAAKKAASKAQTTIVKNAQPAKLIRNIGKLRIISSKAPKLPTAESVRKYKVASWPTRGFIRTYKSGKQVYVRDSVHHRKCFNDDKIPTPTVYVNLRSSNVVS